MEIIKTVFDLLMISGVVLGVVFVIATYFSKSGKTKTIIYLNLMVLFLILNNFQLYCIDAVFRHVNYFERTLLIPFYLLVIPSFYVFLRSYLKVEEKTKSFFLLSIVFFLLEVGTRIVFIPFFYSEKDSFTIARYAQFEEIFNALFTLFIFVNAVLLLFKHSKMYQYVLLFDDLNWLKNFVFIGCIILLSWISAIIINLDMVIYPKIYIYYPLRLSSTMLLFWLGFQGYFNYTIISERIALRTVIASKSNEPIFFSTTDKKVIDKVQSKALQEKSRKDDRFTAIDTYIKSNERYLDPLFSLENLATETELNGNLVSQIINQSVNLNFSDYINQFRIEKAKEYLILDEYSDYNIVSIGLESGFNSKSAFYTAFKKFVKQAPSEYKKTVKA
jgi:AraC-like DNA-binding protein